MTKFKVVIVRFIISLSLFGAACLAEQPANEGAMPLPASMLGSWQVTSVLIDKGIEGKIQGMDYKYNIPKYLGRIFTLTPSKLSINTPKNEICESAKISPQKSTVAMLIAKSISTRFQSGSSPTAEDMRLPLANDAVVDTLYLTCKDKLRAKNRGMAALADLSNVVWFVDLGNNQLAMSWHEQTILTLNRLTDDAKPVASFNCAKASTDVEKTICGSVGIAGYDKSLAQSFKQLMTYYKSKPNTKTVIAELQSSQREWITQRNRCGTDEACLENIMYTRIGDLIYDLGEYMYQNR